MVHLAVNAVQQRIYRLLLNDITSCKDILHLFYADLVSLSQTQYFEIRRSHPNQDTNSVYRHTLSHKYCHTLP
jgi:hypothetical protein